MSVTDRNLLDRVDLDSIGEEIRREAEAATTLYFTVAAAFGALLLYGALTAVQDWAGWLVLGAIVASTVGLTLAVSPLRRG